MTLLPIGDTARDGRAQLVLCPGGSWHMTNELTNFSRGHLA